MKWLMANKFRVLKWSGLGLGCLVVALGAFAGARYAASGSVYEGRLAELAPAECTYILHIPDVPKARSAGDSFLEELIRDDNLPLLEASPLWREKMAKFLDGSLSDFREKTLYQGLKRAESQAESAGVKLFDDMLSGELVICGDEGANGGFVALSRVSRAVRWRWQFMDIASGFFPDGPESPKFEYGDGILVITPRQKIDAPAPQPLYVTLCDDVLVIANSERLFLASLASHGGKPAALPGYEAALKLRSADEAQRHSHTLWIDLDRLRGQLPQGEEGQSPVDTFTSLPVGVVGVYPDILEPLNTMLSRNLDTTVFSGALYGFDLSETGSVRFDQYLLADPGRLEDPAYKYLRETWAQPAKAAGQLALLPGDTMFEVSYRQPLDVVYSEVFSQRDRDSLVGDFIVAMRGDAVTEQLASPPEELLFATAPRSYAPEASFPHGGVDLPLPAFAIGFRAPGAKEEAARALLSEYLQAQRGRNTRSGEPPRQGATKVVEIEVAGRRVWTFDDPRPDDPEKGPSLLKRLLASIRAAVVGEWIMLTNSEELLKAALRAQNGDAKTLANKAAGPFGGVPEASATLYLDWDAFAAYASTRELFKVLRDTKFNPGLVDGRDPREVRNEIVSGFGLDPANVKNLGDPRVAAEFERRKQVWQNLCKTEGDRYVADLQANFRALRFFRDLSLTTTFAKDHVHVRGLLRIG